MRSSFVQQNYPTVIPGNCVCMSYTGDSHIIQSEFQGTIFLAAWDHDIPRYALINAQPVNLKDTHL